jgi:hypothetical protein
VDFRETGTEQTAGREAGAQEDLNEDRSVRRLAVEWDNPDGSEKDMPPQQLPLASLTTALPSRATAAARETGCGSRPMT